MKCEEVRERLLDFLDGEVAPVERAGIQAHLAACPACARELAEVRGVCQQVGNALQAVATAVAPPPGAWARLQGRLRASAPRLARGPALGAALLSRWGWRAALAAVALALLVGFGFSAFYPGGLTAFAQEGVARLIRIVRIPLPTQVADTGQVRIPLPAEGQDLPRVEDLATLDEAEREVAFPISVPGYVPDGLALAGVKVQGPNSVRLVYVGDRPILRLDLVQTRGAREPLLELGVAEPAPGLPIATRMVGGTEVLAVLNPGLAESEGVPEEDLPVTLVVWERDGSVFHMLVSAWRPGLPLREALKIVESVR